MVLGTGVKLMGNIWDSYDNWKTTDVEGQADWDSMFYREWVESLVRLDFPESSEDFIQMITDDRTYSRYYDEHYEF